MKVLLLADTYSEHTEKWALGLADNNIHVGLFSFNKSSYEWYNHKNITVFFEPEKKINPESTATKLSYLKYVTILKKIIKHFGPDILHAHYATSYGLVGALTNFRPFVLSVWGADVYDFPKRSKLHKKILQYNLKKASVLMSTSEVMKNELQKYTKKEIVVTPFGVDINEFQKRDNPKREEDVIYIGTIKPIEIKYGIIHIIEAAEILVKERKDQRFMFYLIGDGNDLNFYEKIITEKKLQDNFVITGRVPFSEISAYHNLLDIFLNVSIDDSESFGVATVEAMACEKLVIVTDVGGLMEVVKNGEYGLIIKRKDTRALVDGINQLLDNSSLTSQMTLKARAHVVENYNWTNNLNQMIREYEKLLENEKAVS